MSNIRQRSIKASELTQSELDSNFKKRVTAKTANYTIAKTDNEDTLEFTGTSLTCTLLASSVLTSTSTGSETGEFSCTYKNLDPTSLTITPDGTDTIDGVNASITLAQYEGVTLQTNNATNGWNIISLHDLTLYIPVSDFTTSSNAFPELASNAISSTFTWTHGLSSVDVDFGYEVTGTNGAATCTVVMIDENGYTRMNNGQGETSITSVVPTTPSTGDIAVQVRNTSGSSNTFTIKVWARKR